MTTSSSQQRGTLPEAKPQQPPPPPITRSDTEPTPLAATSIVYDQVKPARMGNSVFGMLSGTFVSAATFGTAALYTDALSVVAGHFLTSPPPRVMITANGILTNEYSFIAMGRCV